MHRPEKSIKNRILLFTGITVTLTFTIMIYAVFLFMRSYALEKARLIADISISHADERITHFIDDLKTLALSLAENPDIRARHYDNTARILFSIARARSAYVNSVYLGTAEGAFLQRGWGSPTFRTNGGWVYRNLPLRIPYAPILPASFDPRTRPWYRDAVRSRGTIVTDPYPFAGAGKNRHAYGITVASPVYDGKRLVGVIGIDCTLNTLEHFAAAVRISQGGRLIVFGPRREVLLNPFHAETNWAAVHRNLGMAGLEKIFANPAGTIVTSLRDTALLVSYCRNKPTRFTLLAAFPYRKLMQSGMSRFMLIAGLSLLSLLVLSIILYVGLGRLVQPIKDLISTIEKFSKRDFTARAVVSARLQDTDLGKLGLTFNQMAEAIKEYDSTILKQLYTERVTGLANRHRLLMDITNIQQPLLLLVDIDSFKEINDFYGTGIGDCVLHKVGERLAQLLPGLKIFKLPGDEYAILADLATREHHVGELAALVRETIESAPFTCASTEVVVHVTMGAATGDHRGGGRNYEKILLHADMALKRARQKLAPFLLYDDSLMIVQEYENNLSWVRKFKKAVAEDRIIPVFQPIVNNRTAQVEKYETLVRFRDLEGELISPAAFLETARRARLYHEVTRAMARKAIAHFRNLPFEFSINISVDDILNKETSEFLHGLLRAEPAACKRLVFELTESQEIESYHEVREFLLQVKEYGARIAIDDFGSGYSNFSYILQLSVDYIKIDASLIKSIDSDANSEMIVRTIASFARNLGIRTIAEYVHNEAVYNKVRELGIDFSQGYYFGKPEETTL